MRMYVGSENVPVDLVTLVLTRRELEHLAGYAADVAAMEGAGAHVHFSEEPGYAREITLARAEREDLARLAPEVRAEFAGYAWDEDGDGDGDGEETGRWEGRRIAWAEGKGGSSGRLASFLGRIGLRR